MESIIVSEEEDLNPQPYADSIHDRNDRKYAYVSILFAHLAKIKNINFQNSIENSTYIADHIEWAQFHSHLELRSALKNKFTKLITKLAADRDKADAYTAILAAIVRLGYDYVTFNNIVNDRIYVRWALDAVHTGNDQLLIDEINQRIDNEDFLPDNDYLCYAYDNDDPNEFKYARVSLLEAKLAQEVGMQWDFSFQGILDYNSNIAWARFRSVEDMRENLDCKFKQIVKKFPSADHVAKACTEIIKVIADLTHNTKETIENSKSWTLHYDRVLCMLNDNKGDMVEKEMSKFINNESFLISVPSST